MTLIMPPVGQALSALRRADGRAESLLVRKLAQFTDLDAAEKQALARLSTRLRAFRAHADIVREGKPLRVLRVLLDGWACRYKRLEDGRRQIVCFFVPGDICDIGAAALPATDCSIAAVTPVSLAEISQDAIDTLSRRHAGIMRALWCEMRASLSLQNEWIVTLGRRTAVERAAHLFCELFCRQQAVGLAARATCPLPLTQTDLADALGLSAVHVNRTIQELRSAGLITLRDRKLTVHDFEGLARAGLFDACYLKRHRSRED